MLSPTSYLNPVTPAKLDAVLLQANLSEYEDSITDSQLDQSRASDDSGANDDLKESTSSKRKSTIVKTIPIPKFLHHDILLYIFYIHVIQNQGSPWVLSQISKEWRRLATSYSTLWGRITVVPKDMSCPDRYTNTGEWCSTVKALESALKRAKDATLDITFVDFDANQGPQEIDHLMQMMKLLGGPRMKQWGTLAFEGFDSALYTTIDESFGEIGCTLESLESLSIGFPPTRMLELIGRTCQRLRSLHIFGTYTPLISLLNQPWLDQLHSLTLPRGSYVALLHEEDSLKLMAACTKIRQLEFKLPADATTSSLKSCPLPPLLSRLTIYFFENSSWTSWITAAKLTHLVISQLLPARRPTPTSTGYLHLPYLTHLTIGEGATYDYLTAFTCPSLTHLELNRGDPLYTDEDFLALAIYLLSSYNEDGEVYRRLSPKSLTIRDFRSYHTKLPAILLRMPDIETIRIVGKTEKEDRLANYFREGDGQRGIKLCPKLKSLDMDIWFERKYIAGILAMRKKAGCPLEIRYLRKMEDVTKKKSKRDVKWTNEMEELLQT